MNDVHSQANPRPVDDHYDAIILGAGISGLVAASILSAKGDRVLVADNYDHVGGNHMDWTSPEGYTFDVGSLIFQDDSPLVRHFPELLTHYVPVSPSWGRLNPQGKITAYPISIRDDILAAGPVGLMKIFSSVLFARLFSRKLRNARDFAQFWIGPYLLRRSGLEAYMTRFYGLPAEEIDLELARKRMLWISEYASVRNLIRHALKKKTAKSPTNRQMVRPQSGFSSLYEAAVTKLDGRGVRFRLSAQLQAVEKTANGFTVAFPERNVTASRIISTIPIHVSEQLCGLPSKAELRTITLISLYFSFDGRRGFPQTILYNFSHSGLWKRLTVYSDFYGRVREREYFAVEVIGGAEYSVAQAERDFRSHVSNNGLFSGDLKLEGSQILESAYPIYNHGAADRATEATRRLRAFGIESIGRQGQFTYQPTARVSTIEVEAALSQRK